MDSDRADQVAQRLIDMSGNTWQGDHRRMVSIQVTDQPEDIVTHSSHKGFRAKTVAAADYLAAAYVATGAVTLRGSTLSYASMRSDRAVTVQARTLAILQQRDPRLAGIPLGDINSTEFSGLAQVGLVEPRPGQPKQAVLSDEGRDAIRFLGTILRNKRR